MQVYKVFFKIIQKNIPQLIIYVALFLFFAIFLANTYTDPINIDFIETKVNVAFINNDTDSKLIEGLRRYLSKNANLVDIPDKTKELQDALFFREVEYIVRVPEGFTEGLFRGEEIQIEKTIVPRSASGVYMDSIINKYLNTAKLYIENINGLTQEQLISHINRDLSQRGEVIMHSLNLQKSLDEKRTSYFNYLAYSLFAILILGVSTVMTVFHNTDLRRRNLCSPIKLRNINYQLILGNISFAVFAWFIMIFMSFIMYGDFMVTVKGLLLILNSFIFSFSALAISFLIANTVRSKNAISAISNVVPLGTCFISGVFVPQALLGKGVLKLASFTPVYWYISSNNAIANMDNIKFESMGSIFTNMMIIVGFALIITLITLTIIRHKSLRGRNG